MRFLHSIAKGFYSLYGGDIAELLFVMPNRRSALFFTKELSSLSKGPLFSPKITTFKELVVDLSQYRECDWVELLLKLYDSYCQIVESAQSFDLFLEWGETILSDFDQVDSYLVEPAQLFSNIKELNEIESDFSFLSTEQREAIASFWGTILRGEGEGPKENFIAIWSVLLPIYRNFNSRLKEEKCGYSGALFKRVATEPSLLDPLKRYKEVIFVGFNMLSYSEKRIMKELTKMGVADFYWDYNFINSDDPLNIAFRFRDENLSNFPSKRAFFSNSTPVEPPLIEIIETVSQVMQAKVAGELLKKFEGDERGAVILPDESLLDPLLSAIPANIESLNITMGYPFRVTSLASFFTSLLELEWGEKGFYYKRVLPLLNHPITRSVVGDGARKSVNQIRRENMIFISHSLFKEEPFLSLIFTPLSPQDSYKELSTRIISIVEEISTSEKVSKMDKEFLLFVVRLIERLEGILPPISLPSFAKLLRSLLWRLSVPFSGEPLQGVQIMGLLESRTLDFEEIVICSLNEGIFPKISIADSFIPYNLRVGFALPTREESDSLYTYLFYSIISRSKRVSLLYDSSSEGIGAAEASRFIFQLKYLYKMVGSEKSIGYKIELPKRERVSIAKGKEVMEKLQNFTYPKKEGGRSLSASALNSYIDCPLKFYFTYIEAIKEEEEPSEEIAANLFGTLFHYVIEQLYRPFIGKEVKKEQLSMLSKERSKMEFYIGEWFRKERGVTNIEGYNFLIQELIIKYLQFVIEWDSRLAPFRLISSEGRVESRVKIDNSLTVSIMGIVDRRDELVGPNREVLKRVVDYKTGGSENRNYRVDNEIIEALFDSEKSRRNSELFQLLFYALLLKEELPLWVEPYFLREIAIGESRGVMIDSSMLAYFEELVIELIGEIYNPQLNFEATLDRERCNRCNYRSICI
ncbi:MAG: PD-(D/E)XK nuclease family protein [Bacteroidales bacterium]